MSLRFTARAELGADPQVVMRIIGLFTQRYMMPHKMLAEQRGDEMDILVEVDGVSDHLARILCGKMEQMVAVLAADWQQIGSVQLEPIMEGVSATQFVS
jgi:hypothetical protein